jgi:DNA-binding LacI/PurR family transcriptional regulator
MARVTLSDVAAASGVSPSTVSFVLNNAPNQTISAPTRLRIQNAARDLGYVPHGIARALREGSSRVVVLNVGTGHEGNYSRSYVRGMTLELAEHDHVLLVRHGLASSESAQQIIDTIAPRAVLRLGEVYRPGGQDTRRGGRKDLLAADTQVQLEFLADRGHQHIAMAMPPGHVTIRAARLKFAREWAKQVELESFRSFTVGSPRETARKAVGAFLAAHPLTTAIAAFDDEVALRVLGALHDLGVTVPDEIAVIGFDDGEYGEFVTPALTTVHIDAEARGRSDARQALGLPVDGTAISTAKVIVRDSV